MPLSRIMARIRPRRSQEDRSSPIFWRILLTFLGVGGLAVAIVSAYLNWLLEDRAIRQHLAWQGALSLAAANIVEKGFQDARRDLVFLAGLPAATPPYSDEKRDLLDQFNQDRRFSILFFLQGDGQMERIHAGKGQPGATPISFAEQPFVQEALRTGQPVFSDRFVGADGGMALAIDIPVVDYFGRIRGHVGGIMPLSSLFRWALGRWGEVGGGQGFLLDRQGHGVIPVEGHAPAQGSLEILADHSMIREVLGTPAPKTLPEQATTAIRQDFPDGEERLVSYVRLTNGWLVGHLHPLVGIRTEIHRQIGRIASLMAVVLLMASLIGLVVIYVLGLRAKQLEDALARLEHDQEIKIRGHTTRLAAANDALQWEINDRRRAEMERDRFFMLSPDWMWVLGRDERVQRTNPALADRLEYSVAEIDGKWYSGFVHPEDLERVRLVFQRLLEEEEGGRERHFPLRLQTRSGGVIAAEWSLAAQDDRIYAVGRDTE